MKERTARSLEDDHTAEGLHRSMNDPRDEMEQDLHDEPAEGEASAAEEREEGGEVERMRSEYDALNDRHLRLVAEFDNFRKRSFAQLGESGTRAQAQLVGRLVDVLDDLERVTSLDPESATSEAIMEGVAMVERKLFRILEDAGLEVIDAEGEEFDPNTMEAILRVSTDEPEEDDTVDQVVQTGFRFKGHLVRPARVGVRKHE